MFSPGPLLVVLPHPDDESFGTAGTMRIHLEKGFAVTYACLTLGEMGRNMGNPPIATRESLAAIRKKELLSACREIGVQDLRLLGFRDKTLEFEEPGVLSGKIAEVIRDVQPATILTFYPGYAVHPDHNACGSAVIRAVQSLPAGIEPAVFGIAFSHDKDELGPPDVVIDVSDKLEQKLAALRAHQSQTSSMINDLAEKIAAGDAELKSWLGKEAFWRISI